MLAFLIKKFAYWYQSITASQWNAESPNFTKIPYGKLLDTFLKNLGDYFLRNSFPLAISASSYSGRNINDLIIICTWKKNILIYIFVDFTFQHDLLSAGLKHMSVKEFLNCSYNTISLGNVILLVSYSFGFCSVLSRANVACGSRRRRQGQVYPLDLCCWNVSFLD